MRTVFTASLQKGSFLCSVTNLIVVSSLSLSVSFDSYNTSRRAGSEMFKLHYRGDYANFGIRFGLSSRGSAPDIDSSCTLSSAVNLSVPVVVRRENALSA